MPGTITVLFPSHLRTSQPMSWDLLSLLFQGFPGDSVVKNLPADAGEPDLIPGLGRSSGIGNGNPFQYSCLANPMDRGAWQAKPIGLQRIRYN